MSNPMMQAMQQLQEMQRRMEEVQASLLNRFVTEESGGGLVRVTANGAQQVTKLQIDPSVIDPNDREAMEDLIITAVNKAVAAAKEMSDREIKNVTSGMLPNIPGLNLPF